MINPAVESQFEVEKILISTLKLAFFGLSIVLYFAVTDTFKQEHKHITSFDINQIIDKPYEARFVEIPEKKETLVVVITGKDINEKDTHKIAQTVREEKKQDTTVYTYSTDAELGSLEQHPEELKYKAETIEKGTKITQYHFYPDIAADTEISQEWDLSKNKLDLVTGLLTVKLSMDENATREELLAQAKGLTELLILHNPQAKIHQVILEFKVRSQQYQFDSKEAQLLANISYRA